MKHENVHWILKILKLELLNPEKICTDINTRNIDNKSIKNTKISKIIILQQTNSRIQIYIHIILSKQLQQKNIFKLTLK